MFYYHRTRDQFVLVRYANEETLTSGNRNPKPAVLKHGLGTSNNKDGGNARGNLMTLHVDDLSTQKWLFVGFPSDSDGLRIIEKSTRLIMKVVPTLGMDALKYGIYLRMELTLKV